MYLCKYARSTPVHITEWSGTNTTNMVPLHSRTYLRMNVRATPLHITEWSGTKKEYKFTTTTKMQTAEVVKGCARYLLSLR
jgi:hypothetical protein